MVSFTYTGVEDYGHPLDISVLKYYFTVLARRPNHFYPEEFKEVADAVLNRDFNITQNCITVENAEQMYLHLLQTITSLM